MPENSSPEFSRKPLKIKQDDKFFSKLLSKESSVANPSFRVYYGNVTGSVPFTWEIQPGTPKHKYSDNSLPPLTPPPSYYASNLDHDQITKHRLRKCNSRSNFLYNLFMVKKEFKGHVEASSPSALSSPSWSSSSTSTTDVLSSKGYKSRRRRRFMSFGSSFDDVSMYGVSNTSDGSGGGGGSGSYMVVIMKKAFLSIVGRRSG